LTGSIAAAVEEQEAATREIAHNVTSAADRSRLAATSVTSVLSAADQTKSEAANMTQSSDQIAKVSARISHVFEKFLSAISKDVEDRRKAVRHPFDRPATITHDHTRYDARCQDVSLSGLRLSSIPELAVGAQVSVDYGDGVMVARVVWKNATAVGLAFGKPLAKLPSRSADVKFAA
jgi:methyl-accepting chemotaxis protein